MVKNGPHERTNASGETCLDKATRVGETVARTYQVPLTAPLASPPPRSSRHRKTRHGGCFASEPRGHVTTIGFWDLFCYSATQLKLQQERIQVVTT